jgi:ribonuclease PH
LKVVGDEVIDKEVAGEQFGIVAMAIAGNVNVELTGQRESIYETRFSEMLDKAIKGI